MSALAGRDRNKLTQNSSIFGSPGARNRRSDILVRVAISKELLDMLACPICKADLRLESDSAALRCTGCGRLFPIRDGIPDMMPEAADSDRNVSS
jgi:hypothetical protein